MEWSKTWKKYNLPKWAQEVEHLNITIKEN